MFWNKKEKQGLEKAKDLGLITEGEFLRLKAERAGEVLKRYLAKSSKKKK